MVPFMGVHTSTGLRDVCAARSKQKEMSVMATIVATSIYFSIGRVAWQPVSPSTIVKKFAVQETIYNCIIEGDERITNWTHDAAQE